MPMVDHGFTRYMGDTFLAKSRSQVRQHNIEMLFGKPQQKNGQIQKWKANEAIGFYGPNLREKRRHSAQVVLFDLLDAWNCPEGSRRREEMQRK